MAHREDRGERCNNNSRRRQRWFDTRQAFSIGAEGHQLIHSHRSDRPPSALRKSRGLTLVEVLVSMMILGIALGGILPAVWSAVRLNYESAERIRARALATEIYEEIAAKPREKTRRAEILQTPPETPRSEFASVLDYNGLIETPPRDPLGRTIPGAEGFTRKVSLRFVDPKGPERELTEKSDLVEVTVEISRAEETLRTIRFHRSLR